MVIEEQVLWLQVSVTGRNRGRERKKELENAKQMGPERSWRVGRERGEHKSKQRVNVRRKERVL